MIREVAVIEVRPGAEAAFEAAVREARRLFDAAPGCHGVELHRTLETPQRYLLVVLWETVEDHTERFRNSPAFDAWRALAGPHFSGPPQVSHVREVRLG